MKPPPKPEPESRSIAVIDAVRWICPFCGKDNGRPEIVKCACGAVREDEIVTLDA